MARATSIRHKRDYFFHHYLEGYVMLFQSLVVRSAFILTCTLIAAPATAHAQKRPVRESDTKVTVFHLKYVDANEAEKTLSTLFADLVKTGKLNVVANTRTNALFVQAAAKVTKDIEQLLIILDSETPAKTRLKKTRPEVDIKMFHLENADADRTVGLIQNLIGRDVTIAADARTNSLIATGPKDRLAVIEAMVLQLDKADGQTGKRIQLRIVWLVNEKFATKAPSKNLEKIVKDLQEKLGIGNLKMAAQMLVTFDPAGRNFRRPQWRGAGGRGDFEVHGTAEFKDGG
ncbi:MAG: hypothetical protein IID46_15885, partial [Planctomycetes bacterium]|nr:hypothetical protein [Planctomycetota bacterium]